MENGSNGARTRGLSRVRRTLIPAELCFHENDYSTSQLEMQGLKILCFYPEMEDNPV